MEGREVFHADIIRDDPDRFVGKQRVKPTEASTLETSNGVVKVELKVIKFCPGYRVIETRFDCPDRARSPVSHVRERHELCFSNSVSFPA